MKTTTKISSLISIMILFSCGLTSQENSLIGVWELDKKDNGIKWDLMLKPPNEKLVDSKTQKSPEIILKFNENSILDFEQGQQSFRVNYSLKDEQLILGTTEYIILKLNADSLIIKNVSFMPTTYFYIKSDREIKPIKEYEKVEEKYSDGRLKLKGTYHNGFEDGLWEEWFENGQKKRKSEFKDGIPTGSWKEWNESGELINERKMN